MEDRHAKGKGGRRVTTLYLVTCRNGIFPVRLCVCGFALASCQACAACHRNGSWTHGRYQSSAEVAAGAAVLGMKESFKSLCSKPHGKGHLLSTLSATEQKVFVFVRCEVSVHDARVGRVRKSFLVSGELKGVR